MEGEQPTYEINKELLKDFGPKMKLRTTEKTLKSENDFSFEGPKIAWCPDWKLVKNEETNEPILDNEGNKQYEYIDLIITSYRKKVSEAGGTLIFLGFTDKPEDFIGRVDGLIVPGGEDAHPKRYGQEMNGSKPNMETEELRWNHVNSWLNSSQKKLPIMCVCWGYQFLNIMNGGTLIQDLPNAKLHRFGLREFKIVEGTHLHKALGKTSMLGACFHHQNVDKVAENLIVNSHDVKDNSIHGFEYPQDERTIFSVLWHPEITDGLWKEVEYEQDNAKIFKYFVGLASAYKLSQ